MADPMMTPVMHAAQQMLLADRDWQRDRESAYFRDIAHKRQQAFIDALRKSLTDAAGVQVVSPASTKPGNADVGMSGAGGSQA